MIKQANIKLQKAAFPKPGPQPYCAEKRGQTSSQEYARSLMAMNAI